MWGKNTHTFGDFLSGPGVKTPCFHCRGTAGLIPHQVSFAQCSKKRKKKPPLVTRSVKSEMSCVKVKETYGSWRPGVFPAQREKLGGFSNQYHFVSPPCPHSSGNKLGKKRQKEKGNRGHFLNSAQVR